MFPSDLTLLGLKVSNSQSILLKGGILIIRLYMEITAILHLSTSTLFILKLVHNL